MIVNVEFPYVADVVLKRKRLSTPSLYRGFVGVPVRDISAAEAPVAVTYTNFDHEKGEWKNPVALRWCADALWDCCRNG